MELAIFIICILTLVILVALAVYLWRVYQEERNDFEYYERFNELDKRFKDRGDYVEYLQDKLNNANIRYSKESDYVLNEEMEHESI